MSSTLDTRKTVTSPPRIRPNFEQEEKWSVEEVMLLSGKARGTVLYWMREKKFEADSRHVLYRIDAKSCRRFLKIGKTRTPPKSNP